MLYWLLVSTLGLLFGLLLDTWIHNQTYMDVVVRPAPPPPPGEAPLISVIVPARDEARNIGNCARALLAQTYPNFELIVVDDRSTDGTAHILAELARRDSRLRVIKGQPLPPGWAGKPHALSQGAQAAQGAWLCFVDADTFAAPELLASTYAAACASGADLFTLLTRQDMLTFWERVVLPLVFTALSVGFSPRRVNDPSRPDAIANGQFLLFRRSAYEAVGGHLAVRNSIVEDRDLALLVKRAGCRLVIADGRAVARTRMYTSLAEIWEGWSKNVFIGLSGQPRLMGLGVLGAFTLLVGALVLPAWLAAGAIWLARGGGWLAGVVLAEAAGMWAHLLAKRVWVARGLEIPVWSALGVPLGALVFAGIMANSAFRVLSGKGVMWKGRLYRQARESRIDHRE